VGAIITSFVAPRLLYFVFSAVLITSFFGVSSHARRKKMEEESLLNKNEEGLIESNSNNESQPPLESHSASSFSTSPSSRPVTGDKRINAKNEEKDVEIQNRSSNSKYREEVKEQQQQQQKSIGERLAIWLDLKGQYYDRADDKIITYKIERPLLGGACMFGAGIAAGMLGIGAGTFKVSIHELILKMPTKVSTTTSNFIIGITALAGSSIYFSDGLLYLSLAVPMAIGTTAGSILGGRILNRIRVKNLRVIFLITVAFLISQMIYRGITVPR
jgi:hypothetical protein